jgi:hypothetical protein
LVKKYTKVVEENDNYIRIKNRTAVRTTSWFSKKLENHEVVINMYIYCKNCNYYWKKLSYIFYYYLFLWME